MKKNKTRQYHRLQRQRQRRRTQRGAGLFEMVPKQWFVNFPSWEEALKYFQLPSTMQMSAGLANRISGWITEWGPFIAILLFYAYMLHLQAKWKTEKEKVLYNLYAGSQSVMCRICNNNTFNELYELERRYYNSYSYSRRGYHLDYYYVTPDYKTYRCTECGSLERVHRYRNNITKVKIDLLPQPTTQAIIEGPIIEEVN